MATDDLLTKAILAAATAAVSVGLTSLGYSGKVASGEASRAAQDQCCPVARECVALLGDER